MLNAKRLFACLALTAGVMVVGCQQQEQAPETPPAGELAPAPSPAPGEGGQTAPSGGNSQNPSSETKVATAVLGAKGMH